MRDRADHHDAELLLRLYELRREERMRKAREWLAREFEAPSLAELYHRYPPGSQENAFYRMVVSYWEMVGSMVTRGLLNEEFFFENTSEFILVWEKIKHFIPALREARKNPHLMKNFQQLAEKYEKWMAQRAPQALEALREWARTGLMKKSA